MRLSGRAFIAFQHLSHHEFHWPIDDHSSLASALQVKQGRRDSYEKFEWINVDITTWSLKRPTREDMEMADKKYPLVIRRLLPALEPFHGCSLCVRENDAPSIYQYIDKLYTWESPEEYRNNGGRPRKRDVAANVYRKIFPRGHEAVGKSWKEALRDVNAATDGSYHLVTLQRGLNMQDDS